MSENNGGRFDPRVIDGRRPVEAVFKIGGWIFVAPAIAAAIWGIYSPDNFMSVIGISGRRAAGGFVEGSRPIGETIYNATAGKGVRPGTAQTDSSSIRPGAQKNQQN